MASTKPATVTARTIVFGVGEDPVKLGLVANLARPGGNATGVNFFVGEVVPKRLGLLRDLRPAAVRIAVMINPGNVALADTTVREVQKAAGALGMQIEVFEASTNREIDAAFAAIASARTEALFVAPPMPSSLGAAYNWSPGRHATASPRLIPVATTPKSAD
jgi:putative tryptophan/tyrosine transport system substrate-binding protein